MSDEDFAAILKIAANQFARSLRELADCPGAKTMSGDDALRCGADFLLFIASDEYAEVSEATLN
jgi:hypothetical protein